MNTDDNTNTNNNNNNNHYYYNNTTHTESPLSSLEGYVTNAQLSAGRVYTGEVSHDCMHGQGKLITPNEIYTGGFDHNLRHGNGELIEKNVGRIFTGEWAAGRRIRGRMTFTGSCRSYNGDWQQERPHGKGEIIFANGDYYCGEFKAGKLHGIGKIIYHAQGGKIYSGTFMNDQPHGKGIITLPGDNNNNNNNNTIEGYFKRGKQIPAEDKASIEQVIRDVANLSLQDNVTEKDESKKVDSSSPKLLFSTRPPSTVSSYEDISIAQGKTNSNNNINNNSNTIPPKEVISKNNTEENKDKTRTTTTTTKPIKEGQIFPIKEVIPTEFSLPTLPTTRRSGPLDGLRGSSSNLTKKEEQEILSVSASVISGTFLEGCKGWLEKFSIGRSRLGRCNWRRRYFILASFHRLATMSYFEDELCRKPVAFLRLDTNDTRIVTRPSLRTHKEAIKPGRDLCILYIENEKEYKLLLRADSEEEHDYWVEAFRRSFDIVDFPSDFPLLTMSQD